MHMLGQGRGRISAFLAEIIIYLLAALLRIRINLHIYESFFLRPEDGKKTVRGDPLKRLRIIEIGLILHCFLPRSLPGSLRDDTPCPEYLTKSVTDRGCLAQTLRYDITSSRKRVLHSCNLLPDILACLRNRIRQEYIKHLVRQRPESGFPGCSGTRTSLRLERKIYILQLSGVCTTLYYGLKFRCKRSCLRDGFKDGRLAFFHFGIYIHPMTDFRHGNIVQTTGPLLTVSADEWYSRAFLKKGYTILHLPVLHIKSGGYSLYINIFHLNFLIM